MDVLRSKVVEVLSSADKEVLLPAKLDEVNVVDVE